MNTSFETTQEPQKIDGLQQPILKVIGLGGGGGNAVGRMMELGLKGVEFIAANTDHQVLKDNPAPKKILIGPGVTRGLGAGGNPELGNAAARESARDIARALQGADMVFLTAGMGGGTGTGAISVAAEIARSLGAVTIAIVTTPFSFEMGHRQRNANQGMSQLQKHTDTLISIPNDRLLMVAPRDLPLETAFRLADDVLRQAVQGITELITEPGMINVDFSHIRRLMKLGGGALMSIGQGEGRDKAIQAVEQALHHPLLDSVPLNYAKGIIANFTGGEDLTLLEVEAALTHMQEQSGSNAEIVLGVINDESMRGRVQATLVVTGLGALTLEETMSQVDRSAPVSPEPQEPPQPPKPPAWSRSVDRQPTQSPPRKDFSVDTNDLDIPAFLRRRLRYT